MELELDSAVSVVVEAGVERACKYTVRSGNETIVSYETSADVRTPAGLIGLRNVVCRRVEDAEKEPIEARLTAAVDRRADAIDEELGAR